MSHLRSIATTPKYAHLTPEETKNMPNAEVTTLSNGMRVATESNPLNKDTATIGVVIASGSRYEDDINNGSAHFLEHLAFKGTENRSREQLEKELENMGGHLNAYTSREQTNYFSQVMKKDIPQAVDILSDILFRSKMTPQSIEREKSTILQEVDEVYKDMSEYVFDHLHKSAYMANPLGNTILGSKENIQKINRQMLLDYVRKHHTPDRMVLVGTGAVDHKSLVDLAQKQFGRIPSGDKKSRPTMVPARYVGGDYRERQDDLPLAHLAIAYETCGWTDPDTFPLMFMHALIGNWDLSQVNGEHSSSRLISTVAGYRYGEKIMPFNTIYQDTGLFGIYASFYEARLLEGFTCLLNAFSELSTAVNDDAVVETRNALTAAAFSCSDTTSSAFEELGRQILAYGRKMPADEFMHRLNAVDAQAVRKAANRFLYDKDHSLAVVGPILEAPPIEWVRKKSFSMYR